MYRLGVSGCRCGCLGDPRTPLGSIWVRCVPRNLVFRGEFVLISPSRLVLKSGAPSCPLSAFIGLTGAMASSEVARDRKCTPRGTGWRCGGGFHFGEFGEGGVRVRSSGEQTPTSDPQRNGRANRVGNLKAWPCDSDDSLDATCGDPRPRPFLFPTPPPPSWPSIKVRPSCYSHPNSPVMAYAHPHPAEPNTIVPLLSRALHRIRSTPPRIIASPATRTSHSSRQNSRALTPCYSQSPVVLQ